MNATFKSLHVIDGGVQFADGTVQTTASSGGSVPANITADSITLAGNAGNSVTMATNTALCFDGATCSTQSYWDGSQLFFNAGSLGTENIEFDIASASALNLTNTLITLYHPLKFTNPTFEDSNASPHFTFTSLGPNTYEDSDGATATVAAHEFKTLNGRTTGGALLFKIDNGTITSKWSLDKDGNSAQPGFATVSSGVITPVIEDTGTISRVQTPVNGGSTYTSNLAAGSTSTNHLFNTNAVTRTAGKLFEIDNNASAQFSVDFSGNLDVTGTSKFHNYFMDVNSSKRIDAFTGNTTLFIDGQSSAASTTPAYDFQTKVSRSAVATTPLLQIDNGTTAQFKFMADGNMMNSTGIEDFNSVPRINFQYQTAQTGNQYNDTDASATSTAVPHTFTTRTARTTANLHLVEIQNGATTKWSVDKDGNTNQLGSLKFGSNGNVLDSAGLARFNFGSGSGIAYKADLPAASTSSDHVFGSSVTRTAGNLLEVDNLAALKFSVDFAGHVTVASPGSVDTQFIRDNTPTNRIVLGNGTNSLYIDAAPAGSASYAHEFQTGSARTTLPIGLHRFDYASTLIAVIGAVSSSQGFIRLQVGSTLPTCASSGSYILEGTEVIIGGTGGSLTKDCVCTFDGTTSKWLNRFNPTDRTGTTTTCPAS